MTASGTKEAGAAFAIRLSSPVLKDQQDDGILRMKRVLGNSHSPPTYFATMKSQDSDNLRTIITKNKTVLTQARSGDRLNHGKRPGVASINLASNSSKHPLANSHGDAKLGSGGQNAEATGDFPRANQERSRLSQGWANIILRAENRSTQSKNKDKQNQNSSEINNQYNKQGNSASKQAGRLARKNSNASSSIVRCSSTRQKSKILNSHSKSYLIRQTNTSQSNKQIK